MEAYFLLKIIEACDERGVKRGCGHHKKPFTTSHDSKWNPSKERKIEREIIKGRGEEEGMHYLGWW